VSDQGRGRSGRAEVFSNDQRVEASLRHSIKDGVFFSFMTGGSESYFSAFAIFMQASAPMIGMLASLPPLLASFMQILSAWIGRKFGGRKNLIVAGALFQAVCLIPLAFIPVFVPVNGVVLLIPLVFLYLCGPNIGAPQWNSLIGELLPESRRGRFFARRTKISSVATVVALSLSGIVLDVFDRLTEAYWGFVTIFILGCVARCVSAYHLYSMHDPSDKTAALALPADRGFWQRLRQTKLLKFTLFFASMQFAVAISGPYFALYLLRDLGLSYFEFMIISLASVLIQFLTLNRWGRLSDLFGNRVILVTTGSLITFIPSLWLVSTDIYWIMVVQTLSGLSWAGFTLSATAFVFDLTPKEHRATFFAVHNVLAALGVFLGASLGALIVHYVPEVITFGGISLPIFTPLYGLFLISCLVRLAVAVAFLPLLEEVRRVRPMSMGGLIFRVTRMHPISGIVFDIVGRKPRAELDP
jgi:MFS family permease